MRCLIGRDQREQIERRLFAGCRVLEWGCGGSTLWLADRLPRGAHLVSIEHHRDWYERVAQAIGQRDNVTMILSEPRGPIGRNATIEEEDSSGLEAYIHSADGQTFDVILVDGVARGVCMAHARSLLRPGGTVFLHDAHRDWYDGAKAGYVEHGTIGSCEDYPGPLLWWGGTSVERPRYSRAAVPIVISYFTIGTPYEREVDGLRRSCRDLGLEHHIEGVASAGSWERNCAMKARFIREMADRFDRPVLWVDADAVIRQPPVLTAGAEMDFAVHKAHGWQFASGTVYFNRTPLARKVLDEWVALCDAQPEVWDQIHLDTAWERVAARHPLRTQWLPQTYTKIFDLEMEGRVSGEAPVIEQFQASRRFKRVLSTTHRPPQHPPDDLIESRRACRPRRCWYDDRFVLRESDPPPAVWSARGLAA